MIHESQSKQPLRANHDLRDFFLSLRIFGITGFLLGSSVVVQAQDDDVSKPILPSTSRITQGVLPNSTPKLQSGQAVPLVGQGALQPVSNEEATKRYEEKLQAWKDVIKELREVKIAYTISSFSEHEALAQKYGDLYAKGDQLVEELKEAALLKFTTDPEIDPLLAGFLSNMVERDVSRDNYYSAYSIAKELLKTRVNGSKLYNFSGIAAFAMNDFDRAEEWLTRAQEMNEIDQRGLLYKQSIEESRKHWAEEVAKREAEAAADDLPRVKFTTNKGEIIVELYENEAPDTVGNMISLVEDGFYDGLTFHRVLSGFVAQGGCPFGSGNGGPGYVVYCETEREDQRKHFAGTLGMGLVNGKKDTGGSQFFINFAPIPYLNGQHTAFGRVIEGMDVVRSLQRRDPAAEDGETIVADVIEKAEVLRKRDHEYKPNKVVRK